jgi:hypothetical protein
MQCKSSSSSSSSSSISDDDIAPARKKAARAKKPVPSRAVPSILKADATDDNALQTKTLPEIWCCHVFAAFTQVENVDVPTAGPIMCTQYASAAMPLWLHRS